LALVTTLSIGGNLTRDPELKRDRNGKAYVRINIAANPRVRNKETGEWGDGKAVFMNAVAFGDLAENIASTLTKGMRVMAHGTLQTDEWEDKDTGTKKSDKSLVMEDCGPSLMFSSFTAGGRKRADSGPQNADGIGGQNGWAAPNDFGDDTPF